MMFEIFSSVVNFSVMYESFLFFMGGSCGCLTNRNVLLNYIEYLYNYYFTILSVNSQTVSGNGFPVDL